MRLGSRVASAGLLALAVAGSVIGSGSAAASSSRVVGHVYVNDNTAGKNTIAGFDRHANGTLTPTSGSPFWVGGAGTGTGLPSSGRVAAHHGWTLSARR